MLPVPERRRPGVAVVELAIVLPLLMFMFLICLDFARVFYFSQIINTCARNGAMYASDPVIARESPYKNTHEAALADAQALSPTPVVSSITGKDAAGDAYAEVTVKWQFKTVAAFPGIPDTVDITRKVRMRIAPE